MSDHETKRSFAELGSTAAAGAMAYWYSTMPDTRSMGVFAVFAALDIAYGVMVLYKFGRREP